MIYVVTKGGGIDGRVNTLHLSRDSKGQGSNITVLCNAALRVESYSMTYSMALSKHSSDIEVRLDRF